MQKLHKYDPIQFAKNLSVYLLTAILGAGVIYLVNYLMLITGIDLNLEQLYKLKLVHIAFLISCLLIFSICFLLCQLSFKFLHKSNLGVVHKLSGNVFGLALLILLFHFGPVKVDVILLSLSYLIYTTLLDLYQDRRELNSTWVITWMVLISSFLGLMVFDIDLKRDISRRIENIPSAIFERNPDIESSLLKGEIQSLGDDYTFITSTPKLNNSLGLKKSLFKIDPHLWFHPLTGDYLIEMVNDSLTGLFIPKSRKPGMVASELTTSDYRLFAGDKLLLAHVSRTKNLETDFSSGIKRNPDHFIEDGFSHVLYTSDDNFTLIQSEKFPGILRPVSLFSLFFFILSILLFLLSLVNSLWRFMPLQLDLRIFQKKSLRSRIQLSIISLIISSFFVIGVISHYYLQTMAKESDKFAQLDHAELVINRLSNDLDLPVNIPAQDHLNIIARKELQIGRDQILLFNENGETPKQLYRLEDNSASTIRVPQEVLNRLQNDPAQKIYNYKNPADQGVYFTLTQPDKKQWYAYIPGTPMLTGSGKISDIFAALLSIYTILFILSGAIAIGLSNSITRPIELLGKKLKGLKLSKQNEPVQWKNEDEIGALIAIYNEMIQKLSDNAKVMAKVERDSAWKEMAKQVAHEIKNPLTPLKLNIQYLESKIRMNPDGAGELITQITPGLIEQIDNLSQIASEFSNFAQLPTARNEKLRLNEIVKTVHDFFRKREDLGFQLFVPINDILVFADRNHLVRILNNVVKNAIQAIPPDREGEIILQLFKRGNDAIIQVTDNGTGIPLEMQDKVFSPNFTTKSSGTGLGLAISQNMLESFNGRIYFETEEDKGTDFFIEIPLMRLEDNYAAENKVLLDD